jgi:signal transduction histidine kinase
MSATTSRITESPLRRRQPLVVAAICAMVDLSPLALLLAEGPVPPVMWLVAVLVLAVDLALALPTPTSGAVAVVHAIVRVGSALLMAGSAQHAHLDELKQRAERERRSAQEAHAEERGRIARDLHDTISHHVSAIGMQAGAARLGLPDFAQRSILERLLSQIETSGRAAMADLHRMLDLLHGARRDGARQPSLDNLDELIEGVTAAGMDVRVSLHDIDPSTLPQSLDIAAYRIVQEILTNALRHGAGGIVRLDLSQSATELTLSSANVVHAGGGSEAGANRGLNGIHDRAALFRGTVACGPVPERGIWRIGVTFPLTKEQARQ